MRISTISMAATALAGLVVASSARASEGLTPFLPSVTTGLPLGALPPPGFYGSDDNYVVTGNVKDGDGRSLPIHVSNYAVGLSVLWSTPYKVLGARYGADVIQIFASPGVDARGIGGVKTRSLDAFNTIIEPAMLSWDLKNGFFVSVGQSFYLPDGGTHVVNRTRYQTSYANGYFTYEPNLAITYLKNGWNITANNVFDVNTRNDSTGYSSGDAYYVDLTATKTLGKVTAGAIGNYTKQVDDDTKDGVVVGNGNRAEHLMFGPLVSYDFGRFSVTGRYLTDVRTRNDVKLTFFHLSAATKF